MYKSDCHRFKGDVPCELNKLHGITCEDCEYYKSTLERILIIKHGRMGDVLRTTPLLRRLKKEYPKAEIWWITAYPELLPKMVDVPLMFDSAGVLQIQATEFYAAYNLDKYKVCCALMNQVRSSVKKGFYLDGNKTMPFPGAEYMFDIGIDDKLSKARKTSYQEEIFEACGFQFAGEGYVIDRKGQVFQGGFVGNKGKVIGLNTGCGPDWRSRLWKVGNWITLARLLKEKGFVPVLLGGEQEHEINKKIAKEPGVLYFGHFPIHDFIKLVDECDVVVSIVTLAMHIAIGLGKKVVILNNIFNKNEHDPYGRSRIVEPEKPCKCYYGQKCTNSEYFCMDTIKPSRVFNAIKEILNES